MIHTLRWTAITEKSKPQYDEKILFTWFNPENSNFGVSMTNAYDSWIEDHETATATVVIAWTYVPDPFEFMVPEGLNSKEDVINYLKAITG